MIKQIKFIQDLSQVELESLHDSDIYKKVTSNPLYSSLSQDFYTEYFENKWKNLSMVLFCDERPAALLLIFLDDEASYFGLPSVLIVDEKYSLLEGEYTRLLLTELSKSVDESGSVKVCLLESSAIQNYFGNEHVVGVDIAYVDLNDTVEVIKRNVRKSYKSLINWGLKNFSITILDDKNLDREAFTKFMNFHRKVSGKVTRTDKTWDIQYEMIRKGDAFALLADYDSSIASATFIIHSQTEAYYGVGVYDRKLMEEGKPLAHGVLFKAIEICRSKGIKTFILGETNTFSTKKEENIVKFKTGFTKKYFTREHIELTNSQFQNRVLKIR